MQRGRLPTGSETRGLGVLRAGGLREAGQGQGQLELELSRKVLKLSKHCSQEAEVRPRTSDGPAMYLHFGHIGDRQTACHPSPVAVGTVALVGAAEQGVLHARGGRRGPSTAPSVTSPRSPGSANNKMQIS